MTKRGKKKAKQTIKIILLIIIVMILFGVASWYETHYTRDAKVINVSNSIVTVIDRTKNVWTFEGTDFNINDRIELLMNTKHTKDNIYDDEIIKVKKIK